MKITKLFARINKSSKKIKFLVSGLMVGAALSGAIAYAGWTPNRPVFDWNNPADRKGSTKGPVFNSFINTPYYGDERAFFDAGRTDQVTKTTGFKDVLPNVTKGSQEVILRTYVHNNANPALNDAAHNYIGIAKNTQVRITLPTGTANALRARSYITADNASPKQVTDTAELVDANKFSIKYVPGSAVLYNSAHQNGTKLSDNIVNTGARIGFKTMNGNFPGCFEFQAIVEIRVKIVTPKLTIVKEVRKSGQSLWVNKANVNPGDKVQWLLAVQNKGKSVLNHVDVSDQLPPHVKLISKSVRYIDAGQDVVQGDKPLFTTGGIDTGSWAPNGGFYIRFDTTALSDFDGCEVTIRNLGFTKSTQTPKEINDFADVKITKKDCHPTVPTFSCDLLTATVDKDNKFKYTFNANASAAGGATIKMYTFDFGDGHKLVTDKTQVTHTYAKPGDYLAKVTVTVNVNGDTKVVTDEACQVTIHIPVKPPKQQPKELVNTGAGDMAGVFVGTSALGMFMHRKWTLRKSR